MEALRQKVQRNQENPAKKFMTVLKPRSSSMPVAPHNSSSSSSSTTTSSQHHHHHSNHQNRDQKHQTAIPTSTSSTANTNSTSHQLQSKITSPVDVPMARSPIPALPPMNVHSPGLNQEQVAKS